ncbi:hypothetical protein [Noviherbaspirillum sp. Root189]|uniref:hypothetical protein n=1 Tax=Noviherbaspirillum sp. Root189 TaxID=1736487 RepID=UPI00070B761C|nr:hypothetical protein [Noviherbaspirillum sp. Root189]KRB73444.1 hypothetical protein ASE07_06220 [Noviherbaspirillum sp. Root189]
MSRTAFASIVGAFVTAFQAAPAVSANVFRAMPREIAEQHAEAVNVQFDAAEPNAGAISGAPVDWRSRVSVDLYAKSSAVSGDLAVDPLLKAAYERVMQDTTLGGLVDYIGVPYIAAEYDGKGQKTGWIRMVFPVEHRTSNLTLE